MNGTLLVALSGFFFSIMGLCMKELRLGLGTMEVVFFRSAGVLVLTAIGARGDFHKLWGVRRGALFVRGVSGFAALWCYVLALGVIPYAEAATLLYTGPVFTALFAWWFLRETMPRVGWIALCVCLVGSALVLRPEFLFGGGASDFEWSGGAAALAAGVLSGVAYTSVRSCARTETDAAIMFWFATVATIGGGVLMVPEFAWPTLGQWGWIAAMGVSAHVGQVFLTRGLRAEQAGTAMTGAFLVIACAAAWGWLLFGERPSAWAVSGGGCIVVAIVLLSRRRLFRPASPS